MADEQQGCVRRRGLFKVPVMGFLDRNKENHHKLQSGQPVDGLKFQSPEYKEANKLTITFSKTDEPSSQVITKLALNHAI
jgi:hypothetical protein